MEAKNRLSVTVVFLTISLLFAAIQFGGIGGCGSAAAGGGGGGGGDSSDTRGLTGALPVSLPAPLTLGGKTQTTLACTDLQVCCVEYGSTETTPTAIGVGSDCTFNLPLPLSAYYACYLASGTDADADGCKDDYVGSMGCSADGYSGAIPIFPDADGSTEDIDLGTASVEGEKVIAANDPCAQVDQDSDGTPDSEDTDSDGDGTEDTDDVFQGPVCADLCKMDGNENGVPDCLELGRVATTATGDIFNAFFADSDGDRIPDGCDRDIGCLPNANDADGDCIPDAYDACAVDDDGDGLPNCLDCDSIDSSTTTGCHDECATATGCVDFCAVDNDHDGFGLCRDCDDRNPRVNYDCFGANYCQVDNDGDGYGFCLDCSDSSAGAATATSCYTSIDTSINLCTQDFDIDGIGSCEDCDDHNPNNKVTIDADCCAYDYDADGVGFCADCNDSNPLINRMIDADGDHVDACLDCNDSDAGVAFNCFSSGGTTTTNYCDRDDDHDGVSNCNDCNPLDSNNALSNLIPGNCCNVDVDGDGSNICNDCNDFNNSINSKDVDNDGVSTCMGDCNDSDYSKIYNCSGGTSSCGNDFDGDGISSCQDCNDYSYADQGVIPNCCNVDVDEDGIGKCTDCDDFDPTNTSAPCMSTGGFCGDSVCNTGLGEMSTCPVDCGPPTAAFDCSLMSGSTITCSIALDCQQFQANGYCDFGIHTCRFPCGTNTECNPLNTSRLSCQPSSPILHCTTGYCW